MENQFSSELSKLHGHPFSPTAIVDRPYLSSSFRQALAALFYGLEYGTRVLLLSAERGVGKTTLLRYWERRIQPRSRSLFISLNADNAFDVLQTLTAAIGRCAPGDLNAPALQTDDIIRALTTPAKPLVLLLDFNDDSAASAPEILSHLARFESFKDKSLRLAIALPDEVAAELQHSEFAHDIQGVALPALKPTEVEGYIQHRLRIAGWSGGPLFTSSMYASIAERSSGKPSIINELCLKQLQSSRRENGESDKQDHDRKIPTNDHLADSVISGQKTASRSPDTAVDQIAAAQPWFSRPAAIVASIVIILVIAIAGLWYEIAAKANSVNRAARTNAAPTAGIAQHHLIPHNGTAARSTGAAQAMGVALKTAPASTVGVHVTETPRVVLTSPEPVSLHDAGNSGRPVVRQTPKFSRPALSGNRSANAIATLSSASAPAQPSRTAITPRPAATPGEQGAAASEGAQQMAAYEIRLGDTYMKKGEYDKALSSFSRALAFAPDAQEVQEKIKRARRAKTAEESVLQ